MRKTKNAFHWEARRLPSSPRGSVPEDCHLRTYLLGSGGDLWDAGHRGLLLHHLRELGDLGQNEKNHGQDSERTHRKMPFLSFLVINFKKTR